MLAFSLQISFTSSSWCALMNQPRDPLSSIRGPIESLGGKLLHAFFTEDPFDVLAITEVPDTVSPADLAIAFYAGGAVAQIQICQLLTASEARKVFHESSRASTSAPCPKPRALAASAS